LGGGAGAVDVGNIANQHGRKGSKFVLIVDASVEGSMVRDCRVV